MILPHTLRNGSIHTHLDAVGTLLFVKGVLHVVDEWQRHLIHIGALVRQEAAPLLTLGSRTTWIHDRDEQLGAGMGGG